MNITIAVWLVCMVANVFIVRYLNKHDGSAPLSMCFIITILGPVTCAICLLHWLVRLGEPALNWIFARSNKPEDQLPYDEEDY